MVLGAQGTAWSSAAVALEAEKLAFLARPDAYPEPTGSVELRETHMAWVFLTDRHAYKMKKPVRYSYLDYGTLERRRRICRDELRLNRRLADWVYLDVVPLTDEGGGRLALGGTGPALEWLVKMVRLPSRLMLDEAIREGAVDEGGLRRSAAHHGRFCRRADAVRLSARTYRRRLGEKAAENRREIVRAGIPERRIAGLFAAQLAFLEERGDLLGGRCDAGRLIEGHGDLRPEHVFLGEPPALIDCLEFSRAFRIVDPLDEIAFLWMECERLDAGRHGETWLETYLEDGDDRASEALIDFFMSWRAALRAKLALWHLADRLVADPAKWRRQADEYLDLADRHAQRL